MLPTSITVIGGGYAGAVGVFFFLFLPLNDLDSPKLLHATVCECLSS